MTVVPTSLVRDSVLGVETIDRPEDLSILYRPDVAAVVWDRAPLEEFQKWIDSLASDLLPTARIILRPDQVRSALHQLCEGAQTPEVPERALLIDDIAAMADIFANLMRTEFIRLRLDAVTTNACRKFHVDAMVARLVCTYRGAGTEFGNARSGTDPTVVQAVSTGSPILLRGSLWQGDASPDLLHRSPPIEGMGQTRFVLVLDPVDKPHQEEFTLH